VYVGVGNEEIGEIIGRGSREEAEKEVGGNKGTGEGKRLGEGGGAGCREERENKEQEYS
jgi:hypothetical protein